MFCPRCGKELILIEHPPVEDNIDWAEDSQEEIMKKIEVFSKNKPGPYGEREEYECSGGCWRKDYPLYYHHPFRGIDSAPGDSWSLSWVE